MPVSDWGGLQTDFRRIYFEKDHPFGCHRTPYPLMAGPGLNHRTAEMTAFGGYADMRTRFVLSARRF